MLKDKAYYNALTDAIAGCAYHVGDVLGTGFLEKVYENAMAIELANAGLSYTSQQPLHVYFKDQIVGDYFADFVVEGDIILELKAVRAIEKIHFAQCQNYLKATGIKLGLLINFGEEKLRIRRVANGI